MAQNKRFLGLGFTFNATDKGLEKKLTNVRNLFRDINKLSGGAAQNTSKMKFSGPKGTKYSGGLSGSSSVSSGSKQRKSSGISTPSSDDDNFKKLSQIGAMYTKALGKDVGAAYAKEAGILIDKGIKRGRSVADITEQLKRNAEDFSKAAIFLKKEFEAIQRISQYLKKWSSEVINKFEDFLGAVGVNLRDMIPKELTAAFGVMGALARPLKDFVTKSIKGASDQITKMYQEKLINNVDNVSLAIGQDPSKMNLQQGVNAIFDWLSKSSSAKVGKSSKGMSAAQSIPFIGPLIGLFGKLYNAIRDSVLWIIGLGKAVYDFSKWMRFLYADVPIVSELFTALRGFGSWIGKSIIPIIALSGAVYGFVKEIGNWKDSFVSMFSGIGSLFSAIKDYLFTWLKITFQPVTDVISTTVTPIFEMLGGVVKALWDVFAMFGKNFAKVVGMVWDITGSLAKSAATDVRTATQEMQLKNKVVSPQSPVGQQSMDNLSNQKASAENTGMLVDLAKKQNDLMNSLLEKMDEKGIQGPNAVKHEVFIRTNPKEIQAQVRREEVNYATVTGNDQ